MNTFLIVEEQSVFLKAWCDLLSGPLKEDALRTMRQENVAHEWATLYAQDGAKYLTIECTFTDNTEKPVHQSEPVNIIHKLVKRTCLIRTDARELHDGVKLYDLYT